MQSNRVLELFMETFRRMLEAVEARLPERWRVLSRLPVWSWGLAALALVFLFSSVMSALTGVRPEETPAASGLQPGAALPSTSQLAFDALAKLLAVLALFYLIAYGVRRWRKLMPGADNRQITVLESTRLSTRQALHLVKVGDQTLLIGATDAGLALLTEVRTPVVDNLPVAQSWRAEDAPAGSFSAYLEEFKAKV